MNRFNTILFICYWLLLAACNQVQIEIKNVPMNTPVGAQIYLTGNFNQWNPGDPNYLLKYDADRRVYFTTLPSGFGKLNFKFTRGDWSTVEVDSCGGDIPNRSFTIGEDDVCFTYISGFKDLAPIFCGRITLVLDELPQNTPQECEIFLSGNVNYWTLNQRQYQFTCKEDGKYYLTVPRREDKLIFKINRGTWESIEVGPNNRNDESRVITYGEADTVHLKLRTWLDLPNQSLTIKTIVLTQVPKETPNNATFYLAGTFNNWNPADEQYQFKRNKQGQYSVQYTFSESQSEEVKITRGSWEKREINSRGEEMENRVINQSGKDTLYMKVGHWSDTYQMGSAKKENLPKTPDVPPIVLQSVKIENPYAVEDDSYRKIIFILDKVPDMTQVKEKIFLTGDFNDWVTNQKGFEFKDLPNGKKYFVLRLNDRREHEFKITRGDWSNEEADRFRNKLNNRKIHYGSGNDTIRIKIENWIDYIPSKKLVIVIDQLPATTPPLSSFYLSGNFNGWLANVEDYKFKKQQDKYYLTIPQFNENFQEFKITRGSWNTEFANKKGRVLPNQKFSKRSFTDTLHLTIEGWVDMPTFN